MKPALFLISLLVLLSAPILFAPGHAQTSSYAQDMSYGVEVQFWNNTSTYASYLSSKYNVRLVMADNELGWAVFRPSDNNAFVNALAKERFVRFAGQVPQSCPLTCGSGGGSGGGGSGGSSTTPDFSISVSPSYMGLMPGSSGASQIVLTSLNSFYGTIALSLRVSPETQAIRVSPSSVYLNYTGAGTTATSILTIDPYLDVGRYAISVIGTYSPTSLSHTAYMTLDVTTDFGINSIPSSISIQDGSSGTSTVTVSSTGYSGQVNLSTSVSPVLPNGPTASLGVTSVNPSSYPGGTVQVVLQVSTTSSTPLKSYVITVTGTNPSASHSTTVAVTLTVNDPLYPNQWGPHDLNLDKAWLTTTGTGNRVIAVVDTGIWLEHPDLQASLWTNSSDGSHGWNFIDNNNNPEDNFGHGTLVAGVVAGVINNGVGIAGATNEKIMAVRVCYFDYATPPQEFCPDGLVALGVRWAVNHGANVINLSTGKLADQPMTHDAVTEASKKGALVVASAGNSGAGNVECPACYPEVIAVSAIDQNDKIWSSSSTGSKVELSAPGVNIYSTCFQSSQLLYYLNACYDTSTRCCVGLLYDYVSGTSFAAPFVSAIAALAWDYNIQQGTNTLSNQNIRDALDAYVTDLGSSGRDDFFGFGKPDASSLLDNMRSAHPYTLTARWQWGLLSGTETSAKVTVYDGTTAQWVSRDTPLGDSGQVISIPTGHTLGVFYNYYYNDGSHWVYVDHIDGLGGAPTYNDAHSIKCTKYFTFGAVPASDQATYYVGSANSDPYAGTVC